MPGRLIVEPYVVAAKISPEVVLLLVQTSHHAIAFAALAAKLEHAKSLADTALLARDLVLDSPFVAAAELLVETPSAAKPSRRLRMLLVVRLSAEKAMPTVLFFALTSAQRAAQVARCFNINSRFLRLSWQLGFFLLATTKETESCASFGDGPND